MINTQRYHAIKWNVAYKSLERLAQCVVAAVEIEMLRIDVGNDRYRRRQPGESTVALVGLNHHPVACSQAGVSAIGVDYAPVYHSRIQVSRLEQRTDHRCRSRLAVRPRYRQRPFEPH